MNKKIIIPLIFICTNLFSSSFSFSNISIPEFSVPEFTAVEQNINAEFINYYKRDKNNDKILFTREIGYEINTIDRNSFLYNYEIDLGNNKGTFYLRNELKFGYSFKNFNLLDPINNKIIDKTNLLGIIDYKNSISGDEDYKGFGYGIEMEYKIKNTNIKTSFKYILNKLDNDYITYNESTFSFKIKYIF